MVFWAVAVSAKNRRHFKGGGLQAGRVPADEASVRSYAAVTRCLAETGDSRRAECRVGQIPRSRRA